MAPARCRAAARSAPRRPASRPARSCRHLHGATIKDERSDRHHQADHDQERGQWLQGVHHRAGDVGHRFWPSGVRAARATASLIGSPPTSREARPRPRPRRPAAARRSTTVPAGRHRSARTMANTIRTHTSRSNVLTRPWAFRSWSSLISATWPKSGGSSCPTMPASRSIACSASSLEVNSGICRSPPIATMPAFTTRADRLGHHRHEVELDLAALHVDGR